MTERQSRDHVARFNTAVTSGDWTTFLTGFADDAVMTFDGPPVGPFNGKDQIAQGYATQPPEDTMEITSVHSAGAVDTVAFRWTRGGTGTMTIHRRDNLITNLGIAFD